MIPIYADMHTIEPPIVTIDMNSPSNTQLTFHQLVDERAYRSWQYFVDRNSAILAGTDDFSPELADVDWIPPQIKAQSTQKIVVKFTHVKHWQPKPVQWDDDIE